MTGDVYYNDELGMVAIYRDGMIYLVANSKLGIDFDESELAANGWIYMGPV